MPREMDTAPLGSEPRTKPTRKRIAMKTSTRDLDDDMENYVPVLRYASEAMRLALIQLHAAELRQWWAMGKAVAS